MATKMTKSQALLGAANILMNGDRPLDVTAVDSTSGRSRITMKGALVDFFETTANTLLIKANHPKFEKRFRRGKDGRYNITKIAEAVRQSLSEQLIVATKLKAWADKFDEGMADRGFHLYMVDLDYSWNIRHNVVPEGAVLTDGDYAFHLKLGQSVTLCEAYSDKNGGFDTKNFLFYIELHPNQEGLVSVKAYKRYEVRSWEESISQEINEPKEDRRLYSSWQFVELPNATPEAALEAVLSAHETYHLRVCDLADRVFRKREIVQHSKAILADLQKLDLPEYVILSPNDTNPEKVKIGIMLDAEADDAQARELISGIYALCLKLGIKPSRRWAHPFT